MKKPARLPLNRDRVLDHAARLAYGLRASDCLRKRLPPLGQAVVLHHQRSRRRFAAGPRPGTTTPNRSPGTKQATSCNASPAYCTV